jgi:hypothetical protein
MLFHHDDMMHTEIWVTGAEARDKSVEGSGLDPHQTQGANRVQITFLDRWWEGTVIPDCVKDDVWDWVERPIAMTSLKQTAVEARLQLTGGAPISRFQRKKSSGPLRWPGVGLFNRPGPFTPPRCWSVHYCCLKLFFLARCVKSTNFDFSQL